MPNLKQVDLGTALDEKEIDGQIYPAVVENQNDYIIHNYEELLEQLKSLKMEARINTRPFKEPVFYKDYNALAIVIKIVEAKLQRDK